MNPESSFWNNTVKKKVHGHWVRIESPTTSGIPDCCALVDGVTSWVELKNKHRLEDGLGTSAIQRNWLRRWCEMGGRAYLLAKCGQEIFFIWGADVMRKGTLEQWRSIALVHGTKTIDWDEIHYRMTLWSPNPPHGSKSAAVLPLYARTTSTQE